MQGLCSEKPILEAVMEAWMNLQLYLILCVAIVKESIKCLQLQLRSCLSFRGHEAPFLGYGLALELPVSKLHFLEPGVVFMSLDLLLQPLLFKV